MAREKEDYQKNLLEIKDRFGEIQLLPLLQVASFCGMDYRTLLKDDAFPVKKVGGRFYVPAVGLARWLS